MPIALLMTSKKFANKHIFPQFSGCHCLLITDMTLWIA